MKIHLAIVLTAVVFGALTVNPRHAAAADHPWPGTLSADLALDACPGDLIGRPEVSQVRDEIARAETVEDARSLALAPTDSALAALDTAAALMPFSDDLEQAHDRLSAARARIETADTQDRVADEFSGLMLAGLDDDSPANVRVGKIGCSYSTGEIIAIVVGLILGIIPGIILLIVLC